MSAGNGHDTGAVPQWGAHAAASITRDWPRGWIWALYDTRNRPDPSGNPVLLKELPNGRRPTRRLAREAAELAARRLGLTGSSFQTASPWTAEALRAQLALERRQKRAATRARHESNTGAGHSVPVAAAAEVAP